MPGCARGSFRRRSGNPAKHEDAPESVTVKRVSVTGPLETQVHPFGESYLETHVLPLKRLEKPWFVRVEIILPEAATQVMGKQEVNESAKSSDDFQHSSAADMTAQAKSEVSNYPEVEELETNEVLAGRDRDPESEKVTEIEPLVSIFVHCPTENLDCLDRHVSSVATSLASVFALHSEISESIGRLPPPASFSTLKERSESGALTKSLAAVFGLSPIDTVRITGTLLSSLLQYHADTGEFSFTPVSAYHGMYLVCRLSQYCSAFRCSSVRCSRSN